MVLDDISDDAVLIKVAASALGAKVFTENDLHIPDEAAAPQGLKYQVGKSQDLQDDTCQVCMLLCLEGVLPPCGSGVHLMFVLSECSRLCRSLLRPCHLRKEMLQRCARR